MRFRADWRAPVVWLSFSLFNIALTLARFYKHGTASAYTWIQLVSWTAIGTVWVLMLSQSWHFQNDRLVMTRLLLPDLNIPYASITSIDWTRKQNIVLTLGGMPVFRGMEKRTVMVHDMPGFLSEMEHHVAPGVLHI